MEKRKVIIDCDPGIDDTFALFLAKTNTDFDIKALTACFGNNTIDQVTENLGKLNKLFGLNAPVYKGAHKSLFKKPRPVGPFHGANGLGNIQLDLTPSEISEEKAWDAMYRIAKEEGQIELITLGPLTNVAIALAKYEDFQNYVSRVIMMGGSTSFGNEGANSEANVDSDAHALKMVLNSGIRVMMVGLNATETTRLNQTEVEKIFSPLPTDLKIIKDMLVHYRNVQESFGDVDLVIHDLAAMAVAINPEMANIVPRYVDVETADNDMYGRVVIDLRVYATPPSNCDVVYEINKEKYVEMLRQAVAFYGGLNG